MKRVRNREKMIISGTTVRVKSIPDHPHNFRRVFDTPQRWHETAESIIPRRAIGNVICDQLGIVLEVCEEEKFCKVLFHGGLIGWIKCDLLEEYKP